MGFKLLILGTGTDSDRMHLEEWPAKLRQAIPDIEVSACGSIGEAMEVIGEVDAAFGDIRPDLLEKGLNLRWIACPQAGPKAGYYTQASSTAKWW